jgi:hypothetical protein
MKNVHGCIEVYVVLRKLERRPQRRINV